MSKKSIDIEKMLNHPEVQKIISHINPELIERRAYVPTECAVFSGTYTVLKNDEAYQFNIDREAKVQLPKIINNKVQVVERIDSPEELFKEKPDCIMVCTAHNALYEMAKKVLSSGINLFLEKPGVSNLDQAKDLYKIALNKELQIGIGFNHRFHPAIRLAKKITNQNKITWYIFFT